MSHLLRNEREVCFLDCTAETIGGCNVLHLEWPATETSLGSLLSRFTRLGFDVCCGNANTREFRKTSEARFPPEGSSFELCYAWSCLMSSGFQVTDQMNEDFAKLIWDNPIRENELIEIIHSVNAECDSVMIFNLKDMFQSELGEVRNGGFSRGITVVDHAVTEDSVYDTMGLSWENSKLAKVRRAVLTPTRVMFSTEKWTRPNRVIREYGTERFIQVTIQDEDFTLFKPSSTSISKPVATIQSRLNQGLRIGDREYKVLSCSRNWLMNKLEEHGLWMYASDDGHTVESIRHWIGDMPNERCVGTYLAGLGLSFTATESTMDIAKEEVEMIDDVVHDGYLFTEGIGKISKSLAEKV